MLFFIVAHTEAEYFGFCPASVPNEKRKIINQAARNALAYIPKEFDINEHDRETKRTSLSQNDVVTPKGYKAG
jgi:hypothetical protein